MTEDLPDPENRVTLTTCADGTPQIKLSYAGNNVESFARLKDRWVDVLKQAGHAESSIPFHAYFKKRIPLEGVGHQNGTCRFGTDPQTSVLDINCKAHDLDNLYVVDASFFPSCGAVNPSLTIIANAIRVADHLLADRLNESRDCVVVVFHDRHKSVISTEAVHSSTVSSAVERPRILLLPLWFCSTNQIAKADIIKPLFKDRSIMSPERFFHFTSPQAPAVTGDS